MTGESKILTAADFEQMFGEKLSTYVQDKIREYNFVYSDLTLAERDAWLKKIVETLLAEFIVYSGEHRLPQWEKGWGANLEQLAEKPVQEAIMPGYFYKYPVSRIKQNFVKQLTKDFEYNLSSIIQDWLFDKYLREASSVYEFGCGTGYILPRVRAVNERAEIWGLDWAEASQKVVAGMAEKIGDKKIHAHRFDFFNPDKNFHLNKGAAIFTAAALEQTGDKFYKFIDYLLEEKPAICIHMEPIAELLNPNNFVDFLAIEYFKKRHYLNGFLTYLRKLEAEGKIEILHAKRNFIGSLFVEGHSVVVWRPK